MMGGLLIFGLNGCGKTTLGRYLAEKLGWLPMDVEDYYFPDRTAKNPFAVSRSREEVRQLLLADMEARGCFVLSSVYPDWGGEILSRIALAVLLSAPAETRLERIDARTRRRFGDRALPGGDMYARERDFRAFAAARDPAEVERRAAALACPLLRLDARRPVEESALAVLEALRALGIAGGGAGFGADHERGQTPGGR